MASTDRFSFGHSNISYRIMLAVISEEESQSEDFLGYVFRDLVKENPEKSIYILVIPKSLEPVTISILLNQLDKVYNTFFRVSKEDKKDYQIFSLFYNENYNETIAKKNWDVATVSSNVDLSEIPKSYIRHLKQDNIHIKAYPAIQQFDLKPQKYNLHKPDALMGSIPVVAVGGTFDHLHDGHKILLTISAFLAKDTLIIGVTGPELLKNKKYAEYMQPYENRVDNVQSFLNIIGSTVKVDFYEINDICGPTAQLENIDALIVSAESFKGAEFVNNKRTEKGWKKLDVYAIGVLGSSDSETFQNKMSSTDYRRLEYLKDNSRDT